MVCRLKCNAELFLAVKHLLALVAPLRHMVRNARDHNSWEAGHSDDFSQSIVIIISCRRNSKTMSLTNTQVQMLKALLRNKDSAPSIASHFKAQWKMPAALALLTLGGATFFFFDGWHWLSLLLVGYYVGALERDFQWVGKSVAAWPLSRDIINWERVSHLLKEQGVETQQVIQPDGPASGGSAG